MHLGSINWFKFASPASFFAVAERLAVIVRANQALEEFHRGRAV